MKEPQLESIIEGLLFASGNEGMSLKQLKQMTGTDMKRLRQSLEDLQKYYERDERGLTIIQSGPAYFFATKPDLAPYLEQLFESPQHSKLSQASLETLAIIAYKQPITKTEIEDIRGVKCDRSLHTLISRELIEETGRKETIGRPILFGTTKEFLMSFGLTSLEELPSIEIDEHLADGSESDLFLKTFNSGESN